MISVWKQNVHEEPGLVSGDKFLRPPGARTEKEFLSRCLQCGQCAQVCIFDCIEMRTGFNPFLAGTPEINPKIAACHLCMRCSAICPSDALHDIPIEQVRMGFAEIDRNKCYQWAGFLLCRSCYERCTITPTRYVENSRKKDGGT